MDRQAMWHMPGQKCDGWVETVNENEAVVGKDEILLNNVILSRLPFSEETLLVFPLILVVQVRTDRYAQSLGPLRIALHED
jgi:hypothetical protein